MGRVIIDMSPSLDGFVAGRGVTTAMPFGDAGHRLHHWLGFEGVRPTAADQAAANRMFETAGAVVLGRRMFDVGIGLWGENGAFGRPCFVVMHRPAPTLIRGPTSFDFCASLEVALAQARTAAGENDIVVAGGGEIAHQCLVAGVVDEIRLHVVPVVLGGGKSLFAEPMPRLELEVAEVSASPHATHVTYRVVRG